MLETRSTAKTPNPPSVTGTLVDVPQPYTKDVLALGGQLKNTVCFGRSQEAHLSDQHGDLTDASSYRRFLASANHALRIVDPDNLVIAHDLHPTYLSTVFASKLAQKKVAVQHHHAHAVACALDAEVGLPVVGVVCDGTGYGTDGAIWGGEVLLCDATSSQRVAHIDYYPLAGGDAAAKHTWRPALALLREAMEGGTDVAELPPLARVNRSELRLTDRQLDARLNTPDTSSLGRLFDGVAFLVGLCDHNDREGQAAIALQAAAEGRCGGAYPFDILREIAPARIDWRPMIRNLMADVCAKESLTTISQRFHATVAGMLAAAVRLAVDKSGIDRIVLSGGCFFNEILREELTTLLVGEGYSVFSHDRISPGDAGISLGQAWIASAMAARMSGSLD